MAQSPEAPAGIARPPQQGRSRASFERMMTAAEALLIERGSDGFALNDVSRVGKVSIGSIYNRFSSKDELIQAVHARVMDRLCADQTRIVMRARSRSRSPVSLIRAIVDEMGEFLASHAQVMRPMMLRAAFDLVVQDRGRIAHDEMATMVATEVLAHREAIAHPDPDHAVEAVIRISYAAFARELGFGMAEAPQGGTDWKRLKADMGDMAARFLFSAPPADD
ncbi:TetR/AcrR family transcriptional regulator [Sphingomonas sp. 2SG]|uniref:TetR/AcrR family transcriptional regulator n=1 Tax=Sphingomonas sp. 2SG TaxID=2502201 RepID=UPI00201629FB|nr:TetR/AcrR family transcriptional regulator [Sphingomonas sp. 2SG]